MPGLQHKKNVGGIAAIFETNLQQTQKQIQNVLAGVLLDGIQSNYPKQILSIS